jgi:hypothetical protein
VLSKKEKKFKLSFALFFRIYFLPPFLAHALLQYFDFASNVVYGFLHTEHFLSILIPFAIGVF